MAEEPAAALPADALAGAVDFLSIGTNDLSQYTYAADRRVGELAELLDPWQPALLALIAACGEARRRTGRPVGMCGAGARRLSVTSLSMAPRVRWRRSDSRSPPTRSPAAGASPSWRWASTTPRAPARGAGRPTGAIAGEGTGKDAAA
jgi:PEP-utilising enzyme, PEP-binding domain